MANLLRSPPLNQICAVSGIPQRVTLSETWYYSHNGGRFMVTKPIDGKPATVPNGGTIGFLMKDTTQAEAWHKAGVANGGTSIEDPPGVRPNGAYLAYLRDPDGHKLVGVARPAG
jgi:catechol 2,3-dioxygenase-like lactoylglutathione lyase family enzyme